MFQMASIMPVTRGEFRDSCRSNFNSMMLKYQDDIIMLVKKKMESSKTKLKEKAQKSHVVFDNDFKAASNPEAKKSIKTVEKP